MRFQLIENNAEFPNNGETCWYWDTERPYKDEYIAVQVYCDKDPNQIVRHDKMALLFTDQAEYHAVCLDCRAIYGSLQWSGRTRAHDWRNESRRYLEFHTRKKGWCEFCDPVFGNGGWRLD